VPIKLDASEFLKNLRGNSSKLREEAISTIEKCEGVVKPKAVYTFSRVSGITNDRVNLESNHALKSALLRDMLQNGQEIALYVITVGPGLERIATEQGSVLREWLIEKVADYALDKISAHVKLRVAERLGIVVSSFEPGSGTGTLFGLDQQDTIFRLLDPTNNIGVRLTSQHLMIPRKSASAVLAETQEEHTSCAYCPREECENRRERFVGNMNCLSQPISLDKQAS
jgi:5-methyltetrahydrofolate--homocysteine methyltransferase